MTVPFYHVDAFTDTPFRGNPAGVCCLDEAADARWMQDVAAEVNLSETAFVVRRPDGVHDLRWFTPAIEVDLCGHATLATAHVLWETAALAADDQARFETRSGRLAAVRVDGRIELDFPAASTEPTEPPSRLLEALGVRATHVGSTTSVFLVEVATEREVREAAPSFAALRELGIRGVILTAGSNDHRFDFVSRFFAPGAGIDEDPVTGSAHCALAPYWGRKLDRRILVGYQASRRGGIVRCRVAGDRVHLTGEAVTVLRGGLTVA